MNMQKIRAFVQRFQAELFAALGTVIVLWQMLLPGYVLTLDMVFGPYAVSPEYSGLSAAAFPASYLVYLLHFVVAGWIIQKVILFLIFFGLFYLPLRFYPFARTHGEAYFASILFAINPFVYERLLAGQWKVLVGYALIFPLVACLIRFSRDNAWKSVLGTTFWLLLIGLFSLHMLVIGVIVFGIFSLGTVVLKALAREWPAMKTLLYRLALSVALLCAVSMYWVIPAVTAPTTALSTFTEGDWQAFSTASDPHLGTLGNVLALYGFWGAHEPWGDDFVSPKANGPLWALGLVLVAGVVLLGTCKGLRERHARSIVGTLICVAMIAAVFSAGVGSGFLQSFNVWLFEHVPFWKGFRDSQKWSAVLALVYVLLGGLGATTVVAQAKSNRLKRGVLVLLCTFPLLYTPTMLFGLNGQLRSVWYPESWSEANAILEQDTDCKALFLPWHQYYSTAFNHQVLAANTAPRYFGCIIVSAFDAGIGSVGDGSKSFDSDYQALKKLITDNNASPERTIAELEKQGIRYIIYTDDLSAVDPYTYPFLTSSRLNKVLSPEGLALFAVL